MVIVITGIQDNDNVIAGRQVLLCIPIDFLENTSGVISLYRVPIFSDQCDGKTARFKAVAPCHEFRTATTGFCIGLIKNPGKIRLAFQPLRTSKAFSHPLLKVSFDPFDGGGKVQPDHLLLPYGHEIQISGSFLSYSVDRFVSSIFSMGDPFFGSPVMFIFRY